MEKQDKFIKETFEKVHNNLTKFILDMNYTNAQSIHLRNELEEYKSKMIKQENETKNNQIKANQNIRQNLLPLLNNINNPNICLPNSSLFNQKVKNKNILKGFQDINKKFFLQKEKI